MITVKMRVLCVSGVPRCAVRGRAGGRAAAGGPAAGAALERHAAGRRLRPRLPAAPPRLEQPHGRPAGRAARQVPPPQEAAAAAAEAERRLPLAQPLCAGIRSVHTQLSSHAI